MKVFVLVLLAVAAVCALAVEEEHDYALRNPGNLLCLCDPEECEAEADTNCVGDLHCVCNEVSVCPRKVEKKCYQPTPQPLPECPVPTCPVPKCDKCAPPPPAKKCGCSAHVAEHAELTQAAKPANTPHEE